MIYFDLRQHRPQEGRMILMKMLVTEIVCMQVEIGNYVLDFAICNLIFQQQVLKLLDKQLDETIIYQHIFLKE
jgi:hypothetical protein